MPTLSSARRTCIASASAVECTATVAMPSSLQARSTRSAISPRLAIRILSNIALFDNHQRLAVLDGLPVLEQDLRHGAAARLRDLVHGLHRLDDQQRVPRLPGAADIDEGLGARLRRAERGADHR